MPRAPIDALFDHSRILGYRFLRVMNDISTFFPDDGEAGMRVRSPAYDAERMHQYWEGEERWCTRIADCYAEIYSATQKQRFARKAEHYLAEAKLARERQREKV